VETGGCSKTSSLLPQFSIICFETWLQGYHKKFQLRRCNFEPLYRFISAALSIIRLSHFIYVSYPYSFHALGFLVSPNSELTSETVNTFRLFDRLLGWWVGPSQGLTLHRTVQHRKTWA